MPYLVYVKASKAEKSAHDDPEDCKRPDLTITAGKGKRRPQPGSVWECPTCKRQWKLTEQKDWQLLPPEKYIIKAEKFDKKK